MDFTWGGKTTGELTNGCIQCIQGRKSVLFVTGHCNLACYYCPVSNQRMHSGNMYINEVFISENSSIETANELIKTEIKLCGSKGISITGGDPLLAPDRIFKIGKALKSQFGTKFHIHLYTPGREASKEMFSKLVQVVDEIRFHPSNQKDLEMMTLALDFSWDVGVELPATLNLSENKFFQKIVQTYYNESTKRGRLRKFMNLNELEITEANFRDMEKFIGEDSLMEPIVMESRDEAYKIQLELISKYPDFSVFFCPQNEKDNIQIPKRYQFRARNTCHDVDIINESGRDKGLLMRGIIKIRNSKKSINSILDLETLKNQLIEEFEIPKDEFIVDFKKNRIITTPEFLDNFSDELKYFHPDIIFGILEESPTFDQIEFSFIEL